MSIIKVKILSVSDGDYQKIISAIGRPNEDFNDRSYFQHCGFTSIPKAETVGIMLTDGNNCTMIASADELADRPELSDEKDVAIYADANKYIKIKADGDIEASNDSGVILTLENGGDIKLGSGTKKKLMNTDMITAYNTHKHGGTTTIPDLQLSAVLHATSKTEAE